MPAQPTRPESPLHFAATPYGVVEDWIVHLESHARALVQAWMTSAEREDDPLDDVFVGDAGLVLRSSEGCALAVNFDDSVERQMGGNTLNTWAAFDATMRAIDPSCVDKGLFHAHRTPELMEALGDEPPANVLLETVEGARVRVNHVITNGNHPFYIPGPGRPSPTTTGDLSLGEDVFVSSAGADLYPEIERFQGQRLRLAPGRAQCARGIPLKVLRRLHFINFNEEEASQLAEHLRKELGSMELEGNLESAYAFLNLWDPHSTDLPRRRLLLTAAFNLIGIPEVRMTCGEEGMVCMSGRKYQVYSSIQREDAVVQALLAAHPFTPMEHVKVVANGCGDTRLGCELAAEKLGADLPTRLYFGAIMATLNTFNPRPNIFAFPPALIRAAYEKAQAMARENSLSIQEARPPAEALRA